MSEKPPNSTAIPDMKEWRAAREGMFSEWLERSHSTITASPDFQSMKWPMNGAPLIVRMKTRDAAQRVRLLLAVADIYEIHDDVNVIVEVA